MVKVTTMSTKMAMATCLFAAAASAERINFINHCGHDIQLFHSQLAAAVSLEAIIPIGGRHTSTITGPAHMFRHTAEPSSTLFEISIVDPIFFDLSIIVAGPGNCSDFNSCKQNGTKSGFNVPVSVVPTTNVNKGTCSSLFCAADDEVTCADAYLFPMDNTKTHSCPCGTLFDVTFCYANGDSNNGDHGKQEQQEQKGLTTVQPTENPVQQEENPVKHQAGKQEETPAVQQEETSVKQQEETPAVQQEETSVKQQVQQEVSNTVDATNNNTVAGPVDVRAKYTYSGKCAGNVSGTYDAVVDLRTCTKKPVKVNSRVGPLGSGSVSLIFRGPMSILNIAVYISNGGYDPLKRVSYYSSAEQTTKNMVFMNNQGTDYSGKQNQGPQSYASADGKKAATEPTMFIGQLDDALDSSKVGAGPGISTGTEINIMNGEKCNKSNCEGYFGKNDHAGWKGSLMVFVTRVIMFKGLTVDRPAIWMLPAQVLHSAQYGCNCRGMGPKGGCGELDLVEVIETNLQKDKLSTHYYFFDGNVHCPSGDNFVDRRHNESTVYITIFDNAKAMIKIVELASFNFHLLELGSLYDQLLAC